jgi:hypothetical protein
MEWVTLSGPADGGGAIHRAPVSSHYESGDEISADSCLPFDNGAHHLILDQSHYLHHGHGAMFYKLLLMWHHHGASNKRIVSLLAKTPKP